MRMSEIEKCAVEDLGMVFTQEGLDIDAIQNHLNTDLGAETVPDLVEDVSFDCRQKGSILSSEDEQEVSDILNLDTEAETEENKDSFSEVKKRLPVLEQFDSWSDLFDFVRKQTSEIQKETLAVQCFVGGMILIVSSPEPILKGLVGPIMVSKGYKYSRVLKKLIPEEVAKGFMKIDFKPKQKR